jgi:ubiquinone/menaquinone biosynthesis C-methylase UbiE
MPDDRPPLLRIIEEELIDYRIRSWLSHPRYVHSLGLTGDERIVEFGSGGGCLSRALAAALTQGGSLACVDISPYWIAKAQARLKRFTNTGFLPGDIRKMSLPAGHYDTVIIHFALHDVDPAERDDVLAALAAALRPEGTLFIREPANPHHGMLLSEIQALMRGAGLRELHAGCTRSLFWSQVCDGAFRKSW